MRRDATERRRGALPAADVWGACMSPVHCAFCGRVTLKPVAFIAGRPVGSTCAKRHNLGQAIRTERGAIRSAKTEHHLSVARRDAKTQDLFEWAAS